MTAQEIRKRLEEIDQLRFFLSMKDRWSSEDYQKEPDLVYESNQLHKKLRGCEG